MTLSRSCARFFVVVVHENNLNLSIRVGQLESEERLAGHYKQEKEQLD